MGLEDNRVPLTRGIKSDNLIKLEQASDAVHSTFHFVMTCIENADADLFEMALKALNKALRKVLETAIDSHNRINEPDDPPGGND